MPTSDALRRLLAFSAVRCGGLYGPHLRSPVHGSHVLRRAAVRFYVVRCGVLVDDQELA